MEVSQPPDATRSRTMQAVFVSLLVPGAGHLLLGRAKWAAFWFLISQVLLVVGFRLAGNSQLDYTSWIGLGGFSHAIALLIPEMGNFFGTQVMAHLVKSVEAGGRHPEALEWRTLGYLLSGASGVLGPFIAAHAAGCALAQGVPASRPKAVQPGTAAVANLLLPGLGHWLTGRKFKAVFFCMVILGLFWLGMLLGEFADFDRQRHPYYWAGQMALGPVGWLVALITAPIRFTSIPPYIDAGLLFTTSAGLFSVVAALDAYRRAEDDWSGPAAGQAEPEVKAEEPVNDAGAAAAT